MHITDYLKKFSGTLMKGELAREKVIEIIFNKTKIKLDKKQVSLKDESIHLTIKPIERSEIMLKSAQILEELHQDASLKKYIRLQ